MIKANGKVQVQVQAYNAPTLAAEAWTQLGRHDFTTQATAFKYFGIRSQVSRRPLAVAQSVGVRGRAEWRKVSVGSVTPVVVI